jgi:uncharacterized protein (DUF849 family)
LLTLHLEVAADDEETAKAAKSAFRSAVTKIRKAAPDDVVVTGGVAGHIAGGDAFSLTVSEIDAKERKDGR